MPDDTTTGPGELRTTALPESALEKRGYIPPPAPAPHPDAVKGYIPPPAPVAASEPAAPTPPTPTRPAPVPTPRPVPIPDPQIGYIPPKQPPPKPVEPKT